MVAPTFWGHMRRLLVVIRNVVFFAVVFIAIDTALTWLRWSLGSPELRLDHDFLVLLLTTEYVVSGVIAFLATRSVFGRSRRAQRPDETTSPTRAREATPATSFHAQHASGRQPARATETVEPATPSAPESSGRRRSRHERQLVAGAVVASIVVAGGLWIALAGLSPAEKAEPPVADAQQQSLWATLNRWQYRQMQPILNDGRWRLATACAELQRDWVVVVDLLNHAERSNDVVRMPVVIREPYALASLSREFALLDKRWTELGRHQMAGSMWLTAEETRLTRKAARFTSLQRKVVRELEKYGDCDPVVSKRARQAARSFNATLRDWKGTGRAPTVVVN